MMTQLIIIYVALCFSVGVIPFLFTDKRVAVLIAAFAALTLIKILGIGAGLPALADSRLAAEPWHLIAVTRLDQDIFLLSVRYYGGDIRTYSLNITDPSERDAFLKAQQAMKKGRSMNGKARHGRAGLQNDDGMDFGFTDTPVTDPKPRSE